jgi:hypothetical protein
MSGAPIEPPPSSGIAWRKALTVVLAALLSTLPPVVNWRLRVGVVGAAGDELAAGGCSPEVVLLDVWGFAVADRLGSAPDEADGGELSTESGAGPDSVDAVVLPLSLEGDAEPPPPEELLPPLVLALPPVLLLPLPVELLAELAGLAFVLGADRAESPPTLAGLKNPRAPAIRMSPREPPPAAEVFIAVVAARYWLTA